MIWAQIDKLRRWRLPVLVAVGFMGMLWRRALLPAISDLPWVATATGVMDAATVFVGGVLVLWFVADQLRDRTLLSDCWPDKSQNHLIESKPVGSDSRWLKAGLWLEAGLLMLVIANMVGWHSHIFQYIAVICLAAVSVAFLCHAALYGVVLARTSVAPVCVIVLLGAGYFFIHSFQPSVSMNASMFFYGAELAGVVMMPLLVLLLMPWLLNDGRLAPIAAAGVLVAIVLDLLWSTGSPGIVGKFMGFGGGALQLLYWLDVFALIYLVAGIARCKALPTSVAWGLLLIRLAGPHPEVGGEYLLVATGLAVLAATLPPRTTQF